MDGGKGPLWVNGWEAPTPQPNARAALVWTIVISAVRWSCRLCRRLGGSRRACSGRSMDEYASGECRWWHLSEPSPELRKAVESGWLPASGRVLDVGCGLGTELAFLRGLGAFAVGVDVSLDALRMARSQYGEWFMCGDATRLPFASEAFDAVIDRGCFHYLDAISRGMYALEVQRVLRPWGKMLLRACLTSKGERNDMTQEVVTETFAGWRVRLLDESDIPSDTRSMPALVAGLEVPLPSASERDGP